MEDALERATVIKKRQIHSRDLCACCLSVVGASPSFASVHSVIGSGSCNFQRFTLESLGSVDCRSRRQYTIPRLLYSSADLVCWFSKLRSPAFHTSCGRRSSYGTTAPKPIILSFSILVLGTRQGCSRKKSVV